MSDYFTYSPLTPATVARAADINTRFNGVSAGFDLLPPPSYIAEDRSTYSVDTGVANAYIATPPTAITAYNAGLRVRLKAANANTGASTVNVSGLGVKQIVRSDGSALQAGDIVAGQILDLTYDGTAFRLAMAFAEMSPAGVAAKIAAAGAITVNGNLGASSLSTTAVGVAGSFSTTSDSRFEFIRSGVRYGLIAWDNTGLTITPDNGGVLKLTGATTAVTQATGDNSTLIATTAFVKAQGYLSTASPTLTGTPTAPTAAPGTNTTQIATTEFVTAAVSGVSGFAPINSPAFTGNPTAPTPTANDNDTSIATTAFVTTALVPYLATATANANFAPLASPALTGTPTAPTAANGTNTTQIATTAFVLANAISANNPTFTGTVTIPTPSTGDNSTKAASTAYVQSNLINYALTATLASYAPIASPTFTGTPSAPTPTGATNSTRLATTAFVHDNFAPLASPALTGTPTSPTAAIDTATTQVATTAFVDRLRDVPRTTGALSRGKVFATSAGVTFNTAAAGETYSVYNDSASAITLTQGAGVTLRLAGSATTGSRTLAARGMATVWYNSASEAIASGPGVS